MTFPEVRSTTFTRARRMAVAVSVVVCLCSTMGDALAQSVPPVTPADAAVARLGRFDLQQYVRLADRIIVARVEAVTSHDERTSYGDQMIVSTAVLRVEHSLKGSVPAGSNISIDFPGGQIGGLEVTVSHALAFKLGERALVFMVQGPTRWSVLGGKTGKLEIDPRGAIPSLGRPLDEITQDISRALR